MKLIYTLFRDINEARIVAKHLIEQRIAACVNIVNNVESVYYWEGSVISESEVVMLVKTTNECCDEVIREIERLHTYVIPCIVKMDDTNVNMRYYDWMKNFCGSMS